MSIKHQDELLSEIICMFREGASPQCIAETYDLPVTEIKKLIREAVMREDLVD